MKNVYLCHVILIVLCVSGMDGVVGLVIANRSVDYETDIYVELNANIEYLLTFPSSTAVNPYKVRAWSTDATKNLPILIVVRQARQVTSWTVPETLDTSQDNETITFTNTSKTLCHDQMGSIVNPAHPNFDIGPLVISQTFTVAVSTSSATNVSVNIIFQEETDFFMSIDTTYTAMVSPSQSQFQFFKFNDNTSDTVMIQVESEDEICLVISVQDSTCPVMDTNKDVKYEGTYQTVNKNGAITIAKSSHLPGFFFVIVAKPDNYECTTGGTVIPSMLRSDEVLENTIVSIVHITLKESIGKDTYIFATLITMSMIIAFGLVFTGLAFIFNRFGTISKLKIEALTIRDYIEPMSDDEINGIILSQNLTVNTLAKYPKRIKQRSFNYLSHTASIALFYSIPVIQLVVTYQRVMTLTGNEDLCYYNFLCAHPALGFSDFNHIFSNVGYVFLGIFFITAVMDRQYKIRITKDTGIPVHYGLFYAMGLALTIEGILSGCYHICPSQSNYQFDTSFMYVMAVLMMVKLYQNRHPDINATAYSTFSVVGIAIFLAMVGILDGSIVVWIVFLLLYATLIIVLSLKIYYLNFAIYGIKQFYNSYQNSGLCKETVTPIKKGRFVLVVLANVLNFSILGVGVYIYTNNVTDFGTFLLGLLLANTVLHMSFYSIMKLMHNEKIPWESILFGVLCLITWIGSGIFFLDAATLWTVTPAESRQWNQGCVFVEFYDKHDVWHLISAPALYFTFMYLMYLDDDICDKPQKNIPVF